MADDLSRDRAEKLDAEDELAAFRDLFHSPLGTIYLDGNSLGLASLPAERAVRRVLEAWRRLAVGAWTGAEPPWFTLAEELGARMAAVMGALPEEVVVANSTTVNLHQLLATLYTLDAARPRLLLDELAFPSDLYAAWSHLALRGRDPERDLVLVRSPDGYTLDEDDTVAAMAPDVQIAILPTVLYRSGQLLDVERLAAEARRRGVLLGLDCSHSAGALPHNLHAAGVDFAFWCGYKYLNGGPGAAAALFIHDRHFGRAPGLAGWFGSRKDRQFDLAPEFTPADGAGRLQIGSPPILAMAPLLGSLETISEACIERIRSKSLALTTYLISLADAALAELGFRVVTPRDPARRGGHVALAHPEAMRICAALRACGVVPDYRPPDIVRLAPVALYNTFAQCWDAVHTLRAIVASREYERFGTERGMVT